MTKNKTTLLPWALLVALLVLSLTLEIFLPGAEGEVVAVKDKLFFHAWFGFISCALVLLLARALGLLLRRREDYYRE